MKFSNHRLDRFISQNSAFSISDARVLIAQKRILVDGDLALSISQKISAFTHVVVDGECLSARTPVYLMLNKPRGLVSATKDQRHQTILDIVQHPQKSELHIAGRLDFNTTGLVLLTNDGAWSRRLSLPESKLPKVYEVTVAKPLDGSYVDAFRQGVYFAYENITTQPAQLEIISSHSARLSLTEGKYHQVKRMFGQFQNEVLTLHRVSVGRMSLGDLESGKSRLLTAAEVKLD